nr:MAG TPA: hypothetical protein [Bacteriophage sp.]
MMIELQPKGNQLKKSLLQHLKHHKKSLISLMKILKTSRSGVKVAQHLRNR